MINKNSGGNKVNGGITRSSYMYYKNMLNRNKSPNNYIFSKIILIGILSIIIYLILNYIKSTEIKSVSWLDGKDKESKFWKTEYDKFIAVPDNIKDFKHKPSAKDIGVKDGLWYILYLNFLKPILDTRIGASQKSTDVCVYKKGSLSCVGNRTDDTPNGTTYGTTSEQLTAVFTIYDKLKKDKTI